MEARVTAKGDDGGAQVHQGQETKAKQALEKMFTDNMDLEERYGLGLVMKHEETTTGIYMEWISKIFYVSKNGLINTFRKPENIWTRSTMYTGGVKQFI